jgi:O-antigen/teichoic acid export membrane protein
VAWRYRGFALYSTSATVLARLTTQFAPLLLAMFYGLEVAGCYALAQRILASPLSALINPVARVYGSEAARIQREEIGGLDVFFSRTLRRVLCFAVLPTFLFIVGVPWICAIVFGPAWRESGIYCWILAPMLLTLMVAETVSPTLDVLEKQRSALLLHTFSAAAVLICVVAGWAFRFPPRAMLVGLSLASTAANCLMVWLSWRYALGASASWQESLRPELPNLAKAA